MDPRLRTLTGTCSRCGTSLAGSFSREEDGGPVVIRGPHEKPGGGVCQGGSATVIASWPVELVVRRCASGHETKAVVPQGWMPGEWIDSASCASSGCHAAVDLRADVGIVSMIAAFECSACGETSPARVRFGEPLRKVKCMKCPADQEPRPPSFTLAVVGNLQLRLRCEVCGHTWEGEDFALSCPACGSRAGAA